MTKFDNYIYYTICEVSLSLFSKSGYSTYANWCNALGTSIIRNQLSSKETNILIKIVDRVDLFYSLDAQTTGKYVADFFNEKKYLEFERPVRLMMETFKNSIN